MAAPSFVNVSSRANTGFGSSLTPNAPASMVANNLLVCVVFTPNTSETFTFPSPWTNILSMSNSSMSVAIGVAICTGGSMSMPNITWGSNTAVNAYVLQYSGNLSSNTIGAMHDTDSAGTASSTATNPGITTTAANSLVINVLVGASASPSGTPSGYSSEVAATTDHMQVSDVTETSSGTATPAVSQGMGSSTNWADMQVEILSTAPPAPPTYSTLRSVSVSAGL